MPDERKLAAPEPTVKTVKDMLAHPQTQQRFREFTPKFLDAERLFKIAIMAIHNNPKLGDAEPFELLRAMLGVTQLGLEINSPSRQAYLIPFVMGKGTNREKIKIEVVIGYPGWINLALRSGIILDVQPDIATEGEVAAKMFEYVLGDQPFLRHVYHPDRDEDADTPAFAYCVLLLKGGERVFMLMNWKAITRIRNRSPGYRSAKGQGESSKAYLGNPWVADPFQMAAKTVIRRHLKYKPTSSDMQTAVELEDRSGQGDDLTSFLDLDPSQWRAVPAGTAPEKEPERKAEPEPAKKPEPEKKPEPAKKAAKKAAAKKAAPTALTEEDGPLPDEPGASEPDDEQVDTAEEHVPEAAQERSGKAEEETQSPGDKGFNWDDV